MTGAPAGSAGWVARSEAHRPRVTHGTLLAMLGHRVYTGWVTMGCGPTAPPNSYGGQAPLRRVVVAVKVGVSFFP